MINHIFRMVLLILGVSACHPSHSESENPSEHEEVKIQLTAYSNEFELFAEADPFVVGDTSNLLSHFTSLPQFKPLAEGRVTLILTVSGKESRQTLSEPVRKGIYSFDILPQQAGMGAIRFEIESQGGTYAIEVPHITVYASEQEAHAVAEKEAPATVNTTVFTKEQSWKIDFATDYPQTTPFGQVIKATARVESAPAGEMVVTAKSAGVVMFPATPPLQGMAVQKGATLCILSDKGFTENNLGVKLLEAKSRFEKADADYARAKTLAADSIVSGKELLAAKNQYETARAEFENLSTNLNESGQAIASPLSGFIKQLWVSQGSFVEAGDPIMVISQSQNLTLTADLPQRYASLLPMIESATIRSRPDSVAYTLEQLHGRVLSYAKAASADNFLLPVTLQIENNGSFVAGSFVELFLKTSGRKDALTIPVSALLESQGLYYVWVQITPERFEKREVQPGGTDGISVEIKQGLSPQERIVTLGAMPVKLAQTTGTLDPHSGHVH